MNKRCVRGPRRCLLACLAQIVCLSLLVLSSRGARAVELQFAGTLGNSGAAGATLVHASFARQGGGVVVDKQRRIYTGGGDRIIVLNKNGKALWEIHPPGQDFVLGFPCFTIAGNYLYFFAGKPIPMEKKYHHAPYTMVEPNLCRARMTPSGAAEVIVPVSAFAKYTTMDISLTSDPRNGQVFVGYTTEWAVPGEYTIFRVKPEGALEKMFTTAVSLGNMACDEVGNFYVSGGGQLRKFDASGNLLPGPWPVKYPEFTVYGSDYYSAMLTSNAIWGLGPYGFIGRYTRDFKPLPGLVASHLPAHVQILQVIDAPGGNFYIKSPEALYLATIENDKLKLLRRFGAVPVTYDLALTPQGYIGLGDEYQMLWFNFDDRATDAPPVNSQYAGPAARGFGEENGWTTIGLGSHPLDSDPPRTHQDIVRLEPEPMLGNNTAKSLAGGEFKERIHALAKSGRNYFAIAGKTRQLMRSSLAQPLDFKPLEMESKDGFDSMCALGNSTLLLTNQNKLLAYRLDENGALTLLWSLTEASPGDTLGRELHVAADGSHILIADSTRQRLLLFGLASLEAPPALLAHYGEKDIAGSENDHLNQPTFVCLRAGRAVVYDAGNQRVVKLRLR